MASGYSDVGKYKRLGILGRPGNFGCVYRARDRALDAERALKVIPAQQPHELVKKLLEAQILEHCKHTHVVEVKEADVQQVDGDDCVIIACELCAKGSVQGIMESQGVSLKEATRITREALLGLAHLHDRGVMHCDIKPGNLLLDDRSCVKLSDFGLAIQLQMANGPSHIYTLHCPPEILAGQPWAATSDIYAMGVTLYRLLNGTPDIAALAPGNVPDQIRCGRFPDRSGYQDYVPRKLRRICNTAMNVDPAKRYQSADKFRQALDKLVWQTEWHQVSATEWQGQDHARSYRAVISQDAKGWRVDSYVGARRRRSQCAYGLPRQEDAVGHAYSIIAETSLR